MKKIISLAESEDFDALLETYLGTPEFYKEVYDYLKHFHQMLCFCSNSETSFYRQLVQNSSKFMLFFEQDAQVVRVFRKLFEEHWAFWPTLFIYANKNKHTGKYNVELLVKAYKCWLLLYLQKYPAPKQIYSLLTIPELGNDPVFDDAFFLMASTRIVCDKALNRPLIRFMSSEWKKCPPTVQKEVVRNIKRTEIPHHIDDPWDFHVLQERCGAISNWEVLTMSLVPIVLFFLVLYLIFHCWF